MFSGALVTEGIRNWRAELRIPSNTFYSAKPYIKNKNQPKKQKQKQNKTQSFSASVSIVIYMLACRKQWIIFLML